MAQQNPEPNYRELTLEQLLHHTEKIIRLMSQNLEDELRRLHREEEEWKLYKTRKE